MSPDEYDRFNPLRGNRVDQLRTGRHNRFRVRRFNPLRGNRVDQPSGGPFVVLEVRRVSIPYGVIGWINEGKKLLDIKIPVRFQSPTG